MIPTDFEWRGLFTQDAAADTTITITRSADVNGTTVSLVSSVVTSPPLTTGSQLTAVDSEGIGAQSADEWISRTSAA